MVIWGMPATSCVTLNPQKSGNDQDVNFVISDDTGLVMGLLSDTQNCGLRVRRERFPRHRL